MGGQVVADHVNGQAGLRPRPGALVTTQPDPETKHDSRGALVRRSSAPRQRFVWITAGLTALSCVLPLAFADTTASKIAFVVLHLLAAAIIVPVLARYVY
jgi:hypothetical protein